MKPNPDKLSVARPEPDAAPASSLVWSERHPLDPFFSPKNVAVIGATETAGSIGRTIVWNLISNPFGGTVFPVNPKHTSVLGIKSYPNLAAVPEKIDLAIIVTPAATVPGIIEECGAAGVQGAIVISAGFKERGAEGATLEAKLLETARNSKVRIIGPNTLGVIYPPTGLNASFAGAMAKPGNVAFISQSGALCNAVLDWSLKEHVGFSAFVSVGSMVDVGWSDLIDYLGNDPHTKSIVIYLETIGNARAFLSAAREVAFSKPIIVLTAGHSQAAAEAAASHTGTLTSSSEVMEAAFRRTGVLTVNRISEMFDMAEVLSKQPRPLGPRLTILTNAGGPGIIATDALISGQGKLAELTLEILTELNSFLPEHWSHANPLDIIGDATPERYLKALQIAIKNPNSDGILVIVTPQAATDPTATAEQLKQFATTTGKPVLTSWMGGSEMAAGQTILNQAGIPTFPYPDTAVRLFNYMWHYSENLKNLYETPTLPEEESTPDQRRATAIIEAARQAGHTLLNEFESKQVLEAYGIPIIQTLKAYSLPEALDKAAEIGYPVVLKVLSDSILHKSDVGGVQLDLRNAKELSEAYQQIEDRIKEKLGEGHWQGVTVQPMVKLADSYELIIGSSLDPEFGPILLFGSGGQLVEVYKDRALGLPPLNSTLARIMMEQTKVFAALQGVRGRRPVDIAALEQVMVRFSQLVSEQHMIKELDINPLLASPDGLVALDARIVLQGPEVRLETLPKMAIRRYPTRYISQWTLKNGMEVTIRPIRPEDEPLMAAFHETLSEQSVYYRWLHMINLSQRISHERLTRICFIDYDREMALVANYKEPESGKHTIIGVGRLTRLRGTNEAEFATIVSDKYQGMGLGTELLRQLIQVGRTEKLDTIVGYILPENRDMQRVSEKLGFKHHYSIEDQLVKVELTL